MNTLLTAAEWALLQDVVNQAADLDTRERDEYLVKICEGRPQLRSRAQALLAALETDGNVLGEVVEHAASVTFNEALPAIEERIGPYRVVDVLGRGGMGVVYKAVRDDDQYLKEVAIKVTAPGLFSRSLLNRFRNERQILANLDHPNIARLLDGGATESGLPYVVMEYVRGEAIDEYCRSRSLSFRQKLELFARAAKAVQYAHQKLVVHRDLKPANILVTAEGEPKLLDFGIAKLLDLNAQGISPTLTIEAGRLMTPEYASPEQIRDEPITTATDIYQLGVVLYELVSGTRPFRSPSGKITQLERDICERQPDKPGTNTDVDRIILKALEKEPSRRYSSAAEFAADIERYLGGFPIVARPASWSYVTARFVRRNRWAVAAACVFAALIVVSVIGMAVLTRQARTEAKTARQVTAFLIDLFKSNDPNAGRGDQITARELLDRGVPRLESSLKDDPEVRARLLDTMGDIYTQLGSFPEAKRLLAEAMRLRKNVLHRNDVELGDTLRHLADLAGNRSELGAAEQLYGEALRTYRGKVTEKDDRIAAATAGLSSVLYDQGRYHEAEQLDRQALQMRQQNLGPDAPDTLETMNDLQTVLTQEGHYVEAEALAREVLTRRQLTENQWHPDIGTSFGNWARTLELLGRYPEAETAARHGLDVRLHAYRADHPQVQWIRLNLSDALLKEGKTEEGGALAREALVDLLKSVGQDNVGTAYADAMVATALLKENKPEQARPYLEAELATRNKIQPGHFYVASSLQLMGATDRQLHRPELAASEIRQALEVYRSCVGAEHPAFADAEEELAEVELDQGHVAAAKQLIQEALASDRAHLPARHPQTGQAEALLRRITAKTR